MLSRAEASRINGAKSRGPKTEDGRRAASLNALKHGLSAQTIVLPNESEEEFEAELREYILHFEPASKPEMDLVRQLAAANWRLARYTAVETGILQAKMESQRDFVTKKWTQGAESVRLALAFEALAGPGSPLALLNRYQARLHLEYQRILKSLLQLQAARGDAHPKLQNEPEPPADQPSNPPAPEPITREPEITDPQAKELQFEPAMLPSWKTPSFSGSRPMATSRSSPFSLPESSDFRCRTSSC